MKLDDDIIFEVSNHVGPTCILRTKTQSDKEIEIAASTALRYSDSPKDELSNVKVRIVQKNKDDEKELKVFPIEDKILDELRI